MGETKEETMVPEAGAEIAAAVRLARSIGKGVTDSPSGDVEGQSFDAEDILERHAAVNIICCLD